MTATDRAESALAFDADGLLPVVAQDAATGAVLLLAYMNREALERTLAEGVLVLWSRSRQRLWRKGERSGHTLRLRELRVNCEDNSLLARVVPQGAGACHEGYATCYYRQLARRADGSLAATVVEPRTFDPAAVYGDPHPQPLSLRGKGSQDADESDLEAVARALYAAYERLRDGEEDVDSGTSRLLHAADRRVTAKRALERADEELEELRGVIAGTHRHTGDERDVVLEASQVGYWTTVAAVALGHTYDDWMPHAAWLAGWNGTPLAVAPLPGDVATQTCRALLVRAGALCRAGTVAPEDVLRADLDAMRARHG